MCYAQARNQLGSPGMAKSILRRAQSFSNYCISNSFQLCPTAFSTGGEKVCRGVFVPPCDPVVTSLARLCTRRL